jgi:hypothetical protein
MENTENQEPQVENIENHTFQEQKTEQIPAKQTKSKFFTF